MSHRPVRSAHHVTVVLLTLLVVSGLAGCAARMPAVSTPAPDLAPIATATPHIIPVSVTVLAQAAPLGDTPAQPVYALVVEDSDWDRLERQIPEAALQRGRQAGDAAHVIVVAFAGVKGSNGYQVSVRQAALQAGELIVTVAVTGPGEDDIVEPASTLPFALATLPRDAVAAARSYAFIDDYGQVLNRGQVLAP